MLKKMSEKNTNNKDHRNDVSEEHGTQKSKIILNDIEFGKY